ncbi:MAG: LptA/OstA family protein [bacterium]
MTMSGDSASWNKEKQTLVLKGNVVLKRGSITLKAPIVRLKGEIENPEKIIASGGVIVSDKERNAIIKAETIEVFLKEKRGWAKQGVRIEYKNRVILGKQGVYDGLKNIAELKGSCTMTEAGRVFEAETMRYFTEEDKIEFEGSVKGKMEVKNKKGDGSIFSRGKFEVKNEKRGRFYF